MQQVLFNDLGLVGFNTAWDIQEGLFNKMAGEKMARRKAGDDTPVDLPHWLLFCEHPHVYTLGKSGSKDNLLIDGDGLKARDAEYVKINRGGDITYHGPGQIVGYPILDLERFFTDIHKYLRLLEEAVIRTLSEHGLASGRVDGLTGVWVDHEDPRKARKICALGVRTSRWVTMHGFAFNLDCDLSYFDNIIPCGIKDKDVTSLAMELGKAPDRAKVQDQLKHHLAHLFGMDIVTADLPPHVALKEEGTGHG